MKRIFNKELCTGCGNCIDSCPKKILTISNDVNVKGSHYVVIQEDECIGCRRCEVMCTTLATTFDDDTAAYLKLMKNMEFPPHTGCPLGFISKLLAEIVAEMKIENEIVIFKGSTVEVHIACEIHACDPNEYFKQAIEYKKNNPGKIVVVIYTDSKQKWHEKAALDLKMLNDEKVTVIHSLNYFEKVGNYQGCEKYTKHLLEEVANQEHASFIARGSLNSVKNINDSKNYIKHAILNQQQNKNFSIVELTFPCYYRLEERPKEQIQYIKLKEINEWFDKYISNDFKTGIYKND